MALKGTTALNIKKNFPSIFQNWPKINAKDQTQNVVFGIVLSFEGTSNVSCVLNIYNHKKRDM